MTDSKSENLIAFQGVAGAHSDTASKLAHPYLTSLPCPTFDAVFEAVESGRAKYGMIPIENSYAGRVAEIHNLLPSTNLHFIGEYFHTVRHHLMGVKGTKLEQVKSVYSHHQALMQCNKTILKLGLTPEPFSDTAGAAEVIAAEKNPAKAAIASELAAELYGLEILQRDMQDASDNRTLFVTISREPVEYDPAKEKNLLCSAIFTTRNLPAGLYKALGGFATNNVNLMKLESYIPDYAGGTARFFITFEGSPQMKPVSLALEELGFFCKDFKLLGVYPADKQRYR